MKKNFFFIFKTVFLSLCVCDANHVTWAGAVASSKLYFNSSKMEMGFTSTNPVCVCVSLSSFLFSKFKIEQFFFQFKQIEKKEDAAI